MSQKLNKYETRLHNALNEFMLYLMRTYDPSTCSLRSVARDIIGVASILKLMDSSDVAAKLTKYLIPYEKQIKERDEEFMVSGDVKDFVESESTDVSATMDQIMMFRKLWVSKDTNKTTKNIIWEHLHEMLKYAKKCDKHGEQDD